MKRNLLLAVMLAAALLACLSAAAQAQQQEQPPQQTTEETTPHDLAKERASDLARQFGAQVQTFARYADGHLQRVTATPLYGWVLFGLGLLLGMLALLFGWTFVKSLLVPAAPVLGLATGGFVAFCVVEVLYTERPQWFRLLLLGLGAIGGVALYLVSALRAKPVAAFLVIMSPFLIISAFLFPYSSLMGLVVFCVGFLAGFGAMIQVRPLAIIATSMLGACALLACWGALSHLMGGSPAFIRDFFEWLLNNPAMFAVAWAVVVFMGSSFQFATAPRGGLQT